MELSEKIKLIRNNHNERQEDFAQKIGVGISTLKKYEKGTSKPDIVTIMKIKEKYNVTYEYLLEDKTENSNAKTIKIGKELHLSDKAIQNIKEMSNIKYFNDNIFMKQKHLINTVGTNNSNFRDVTNSIDILNNSNIINMFNSFIENFKELPQYMRALSELNTLIELLKNLDFFKTLCSIFKVVEKLIINKNTEEIKELIDYYDKKLEILELLSFSTIHSEKINLKVKANYEKIKIQILAYNLQEMQENLDDLKSEILLVIHFINRDISRCKYELTEILNQYYNDLINIARDNMYNSTNEFKEKYIRDLIRQNQEMINSENKK